MNHAKYLSRLAVLCILISVTLSQPSLSQIQENNTIYFPLSLQDSLIHTLNRIVFLSDRDADPDLQYKSSDIYTMNADGSDVVRLTHDIGYISSHPVWSPDGTRIAFTLSTLSDIKRGLMVMDADGTNLTKIFDDANEPRWSPDGTRIAFGTLNSVRWSDAYTIYSIAPDGSDLMMLIEGNPSWAVDNPVWSPDSLKIAFRSFAKYGPPNAEEPYYHILQGN
jgi:Tol biopolymer transport system component